MQKMVASSSAESADRGGVSWVIGPVGERLTLDKLPPAGCPRWRPKTKAAVVAAVDGGLLPFADALERYNLTPEELASWQRASKSFGMNGLRATRAVEYRDKTARQAKSLC